MTARDSLDHELQALGDELRERPSVAEAVLGVIAKEVGSATEEATLFTYEL